MSASNQNFVNNGYSELKNQPTNAYFGATLRVIYMFALSGNMYNAISNNTLGTEADTQNSFSFYPNPVLNDLNISFTTSRYRNINVYSINGQLLLSKNENALSVKIDLSNFKAGIYFLNIDNKENLKIIKT